MYEHPPVPACERYFDGVLQINPLGFLLLVDVAEQFVFDSGLSHDAVHMNSEGTTLGVTTRARLPGTAFTS